MSETHPGDKYNAVSNKEGDGLTARQYAAIKLRVPDSGADWLDAMIRRSRRMDFAALAMHAEINTAGAHEAAREAFQAGMEEWGHGVEEHIAFNAYEVADAMIANEEGTTEEPNHE